MTFTSCISIHALREEGDQPPRCSPAQQKRFLSTPSARRATQLWGQRWCCLGISIHALREEGDIQKKYEKSQEKISIHALREEGDQGRHHDHHGQQISIHALREEGDRIVDGIPRIVSDISIHALREEGDLTSHCSPRMTVYFYPRPPRGGRPNNARPAASRTDFYPRPPRGGRRRCQGRRGWHSPISIHALREEGDAVSCRMQWRRKNFYPRPPRGGRPVPWLLSIGRCMNFYPRPPRGGRL